MRIFSFLKRSSEKKEGVKEIELGQLGEWIGSLGGQAFETANQKLIGIKKDITEEKRGISENLQKLMDTELKNQSIPERAKQIRESNRITYVQKLLNLVQEVSVPEEFDELAGFCSSFDAALASFSSSTVKNYYVLKQFFENEASAIAANLKNMERLVKSIQEAVEDAGIDKINELMDSFKGVQQKIKLKQELNEKIGMVGEELKQENRGVVEWQKRLRGLEQSQAYKEFAGLLDKKQLLVQELEGLKKQMFHSFSVINAALKKYERMTLQDKLVRGYLEDFLSALLGDKQLKIAEIVDKIAASIGNGELELKGKKKDKILQELHKLDKAYFEAFLGRYHELNKRLGSLKSEIENSDAAKEAEQIKSLLRQIVYRVEETSKRLQQKKTEESGIDVEKLSKNLEIGIKSKLGRDVKIISQ